MRVRQFQVDIAPLRIDLHRRAIRDDRFVFEGFVEQFIALAEMVVGGRLGARPRQSRETECEEGAQSTYLRL